MNIVHTAYTLFRKAPRMQCSPFKHTTKRGAVSGMLLAVLGLSHLSSSAVARAQEAPNCLREVDARDQYGSTVTVDLVDRLHVPSVKLEIPVGLPLSVDGVGPEARERNPLSACAPEPLAARFAYFVFNHKPEESIGLVGGLTVGRMVLRFFDVSADAQYAHMAQLASGAGTEQTALPNGFTRNSAVGDGPFGNYVLPAGGEAERPIYMSCSPAMDDTECRVNHQWDNGLNLNYWFDYDAVDPADWISLDGAVREAVEAMSAGGHLQ